MQVQVRVKRTGNRSYFFYMIRSCPGKLTYAGSECYKLFKRMLPDRRSHLNKFKGNGRAEKKFDNAGCYTGLHTTNQKPKYFKILIE